MSVLRAAKTARELGVTVVAMTGESGGQLAEFADFLINVPSRDTGRIQDRKKRVAGTRRSFEGPGKNGVVVIVVGHRC